MPAPANPLTADKALIMAAIELFGRDGFAAVSIRSLSEYAGTNIASIKYYFGGKDELYKAAVLHVVGELKPKMDFAMAVFRAGRDDAGTDPAKQAQVIKLLVDRLTHMFLESEDIPIFLPFVLREFFVPGPYFDIFYESLPQVLHSLFAEIVAMTFGTNPTDERVVVQAHALIGQIMIFHVGRQILFRRLNWDKFTPERVDMIVQEVQQSILKSLALADPDRGDV